MPHVVAVCVDADGCAVEGSKAFVAAEAVAEAVAVAEVMGWRRCAAVSTAMLLTLVLVLLALPLLLMV